MKINAIKSSAFYTILWLTCSISPPALALATAIIQVNTIPEELYENEPFNLIFQTIDIVDGAPDFSPLEKDFTITTTTQRNDFDMFTGKFARNDNWVVELIPDKAGRFIIPEIAFGRDRSPSISLIIKPQSKQLNAAKRNFISELEASHTTVFVGSQIIITQRMLSTRKTARPSFSELKKSGVNVMQEKLDDGKPYDIKRGDKTYHVLEIKHAIYPQQTGQLYIEPSVAVAQVAASGDGSINPLMNNAITKNASSAPIEIKINPIPESFNQKNWLPAKEVRLQEEWTESGTTFNVGEPITRSYSVYVDGLGFAQLPALAIGTVENLKRYPDKPVSRNKISSSGISSSVKTRVVLIPTQPGTFTLPSIEIPWWNTVTNERVVSSIPPRRITVIGAGTENTATAPAGTTKPASSENMVSTKPRRSENERLYLWLSIFFGMGWGSTILLWADINRSRKKRLIIPPSKEPATLYQAGKTLMKACSTAQATACERALIAWGKIIFHDNTLTSLGALKQRVEDPLQSEIGKLEIELYSANTSGWNADEIWRTSLLIDVNPQAQKILSDLEPMYK
ncbi:MAG: BatD family protein [Gammaproteobacteria bacterium]|nr:BatD family protein [Gammaproteobacteria bacterium]